MSSPTEKVSADEAVGSAVLTILLLPVCYWIEGIAISHLWNWFVLPTFATAPHLRTSIAVGLMVLAQTIRGPGKTSEKEGAEWITEIITKGIAFPALGLLMGWIIVRVWL